MKKLKLLLCSFAIVTTTFAETDSVSTAVDIQAQLDSLEKTFTYQHGTIELNNGIGKINVPEGFKYLDIPQAERVLVELWGNPKYDNMTLGLLVPEKLGVMEASSWVFDIQYDEMGYVKDDDADDIEYDELLSNMQKETEEGNAERIKGGYAPITLIGWASSPFYDKDKKILHWAKELQFGDSSNTEHTLNYNVRILGRKGVLVMNAIAVMSQLEEVKTNVPKITSCVEFGDGNKYSDFDPGIDEVAAWTIGGLVAGKVLAKVGFWVVLAKFWKVIALAVAGGGGYIWKRISGKKDENPMA